MSVSFEPFSAEIRDDPYPAYAMLRAHAPVHFAPEARVYCVARYHDVHSVLIDPALFSSSAMRTVLQPGRGLRLRLAHVWPILRMLWKARFAQMGRAENLITLDPPLHDTLRAIVNRGVSPRRIADWETRIREIVAEELGPKVRSGEPIDVVGDLAVPVPTRVIAELLGIPPESRADFKRWSDGIIAAVSGPERADPIAHGMLDHFASLQRFLREIIRERRARPRDDLISLLVDPDQGHVLDEPHTIQFVLLLLVAGNETTTNLIGNAAQALVGAPEQLACVADDPSRIPDLVEETLRFDPPVQMLFRTATRDTEIGGVSIPAGSAVAPILASANRDPDRFDEPDRFDVRRAARGHLSFGFGLHFCLGASLARLEARVALEALVPEMRRRTPRAAHAPVIDSFLVRGRRELWLESSGTGTSTRAV